MNSDALQSMVGRHRPPRLQAASGAAVPGGGVVLVAAGGGLATDRAAAGEIAGDDPAAEPARTW